MACLVLPGLYGLMVQGVLFLCCVGTLLAKWKFETRQEIRQGKTPRKFWTFLLDGSKQLGGAAWLHVTNLTFAKILTTFVGKGDECEWYWINIMLDTTVGSAVAWVMLKLVNQAVERCLGGKQEAKEWTTSGHYYVDGHFKWSMFIKQGFLWIVIVVTSMKAVMVILMITFHLHFLDIASWMLAGFLFDNRLKLLVVMILTPTIMNAFQFWVVDNIIKLSKTHKDMLNREQEFKNTEQFNQGLLTKPGSQPAPSRV